MVSIMDSMQATMEISCMGEQSVPGAPSDFLSTWERGYSIVAYNCKSAGVPSFQALVCGYRHGIFIILWCIYDAIWNSTTLMWGILKSDWYCQLQSSVSLNSNKLPDHFSYEQPGYKTTIWLEPPNSLFVEMGVVSEPFKHTCTSNSTINCA